MKKVAGDSLPMSQVTPAFCQEFKEYFLLSKLAQNSAHSYFLKFREAINEATSEGLIESDPLKKVKLIPAAETKREFLTLEELQAMAQAECPLDWLKAAALFTALTGLRFVDLQNLKWEDVQHSKESGYYIRFTQMKSKGVPDEKQRSRNLTDQ